MHQVQQELLENLNKIKMETEKAIQERDYVRRELDNLRQNYEASERSNQIRSEALLAARPNYYQDGLGEFLREYGANEGRIPPEQKYTSQQIRKPQNYNDYDNPGTMRFKGESNFVPLEAFNRQDTKDMTLRDLAKYRFGEPPKVQQHKPVFFNDDYMEDTSKEMRRVRAERPNTHQNIRDSNVYQERYDQTNGESRSVFQRIGGNMLAKAQPNNSFDPMEDTVDRLISHYSNPSRPQHQQREELDLGTHESIDIAKLAGRNATRLDKLSKFEEVNYNDTKKSGDFSHLDHLLNQYLN